MIQRLRNLISFPLLTRELTERSARPRTYWMRVIYGLLLYGIFLYNFRGADEQRSTFANLGMGREYFTILLALQLAGVVFFQPGLMAGSITSEKERDSLSLLFLTKMSPWRILLEKLFSGLFPMATLLLLSLPLGAVCFAYGGISQDYVCSMLLLIVATWFQIACFSLLCSARFRSTVTAFIMTYVGGILFYLAFPILHATYKAYFTSSSHWNLDSTDWSWCFIPIQAFDRFHSEANIYGFGSRKMLSGWEMFYSALGHALPLFASSCAFLLVARYMLVKHGDNERKKSRIFEFLTGWWRRRWVKKAGHADLPRTNPVAWREASRGWLAAKEQKVYGFAVGSTLVMTICLMLYRAVPVLMILVGILTVLLLCVRAANSIVSERVSQTLDVLLTTKLTAREIIQQKATPVIRFGLLATFMLSIIYAFIGGGLDGYGYSYSRGYGDLSTKQLIQTWCILTSSTLAYVPLIVWISLWLGLRIHSRFKVILTSFGIFAGWFILPMIGAVILYGSNTYGAANVVLGPGGVFKAVLREESAYYREKHRNTFYDYLNPNKKGYVLMRGNQTVQVLEETFGNLWHLGLINVALYGGIGLIVRSISLRNADRLLRR